MSRAASAPTAARVDGNTASKTAGPVPPLSSCPPPPRPRLPRFLLARRVSQLLILALFAAGPLAGLWIVKGTLGSSLTLGVLPLTDPLLALQSLLAHHSLTRTAVIGAGSVTLFYALFGGRLFCSWVCPVNLLTDAAAGLRRWLGWSERVILLSRQTRLWLLAGVLAGSAATGTIIWERVNPVTLLQRDLLFPGLVAATLPVLLPLLVFLLDLLGGARLWCGHLCPVGAFYGLLGRWSLFKVSAVHRDRCDDCRACYRVCPEPHVLTPALRGAARGLSPLVSSADCTVCGRCADVCDQSVFIIGPRPRLNALSQPRKELP